MSVFDRLDRMTSRTVDSVNAIAFTLTPMKRTPNGRAVPDDSRPIIEGRGVFELDEAQPIVELGNRDRRGNDLRAILTGAQPVLSVDRRYFPTSEDEPRQGARVEFPGRPDLEIYEVVSVERDGLARLVIKLVG